METIVRWKALLNVGHHWDPLECNLYVPRSRWRDANAVRLLPCTGVWKGKVWMLEGNPCDSKDLHGCQDGCERERTVCFQNDQQSHEQASFFWATAVFSPESSVSNKGQWPISGPQIISQPWTFIKCMRTGGATYLSWLRASAVNVDTVVPVQPVSIHQGLWMKSPTKMISPLRGLLTNITWEVPRKIQSTSWTIKGFSGGDQRKTLL